LGHERKQTEGDKYKISTGQSYEEPDSYLGKATAKSALLAKLGLKDPSAESKNYIDEYLTYK